MQLNLILSQSNIAFGTSGARGLVTDFTDTVCAAFAQSFVLVMQRSFSFNRVALAIDNRPSSPQMAAACAGLLQAMGFEVDYYGVVPTPALAYQAMQQAVPAIMITGSHIPFDRNGIKFYRPDGEISKQDELAIMQQTAELIAFSAYLPQLSFAAAENYLQRYISYFPAGILAGKHIGIYEHSSAGRDLYAKVFSALGATVTALGRSDSFVPIDTEAVAEADIIRAKEWSNNYNFDAIFSTDGDGDRPLIADEYGRWLRGDIVGLLCAKALGIQAIAVPVNANTAIDKSGYFNQVVRTRIGSPYVIEAFANLTAQFDKVAGFEANGGFLLASDITNQVATLKALPTRDALLPVLAILVASAHSSVSALCQVLPPRVTASDRLQSVTQSWCKALLELAIAKPEFVLDQLGLKADLQATDTTDGVRWVLLNGDIVHIRPSGNAPELRCYVEAVNEQSATELLQRTMAKLSVMPAINV